MGRTHSLLRTLATILVVIGLVMAGAGDVAARGKKKKKVVKKKGPTAAEIKAQEKALGELRGVFKFGMTKDQILKILKKQLSEQYAEKIHATSDVYTQDKLRREEGRKLREVKKSYVEFNGKKTGWDVSIIDDQFRHNTGESMMVYWDPTGGKDQRKFFFFHDGKLYKIFLQLSTENVEGTKGFAFYQGLLEKKFGTGEVGFRTDKDGIEWPDRIIWKTPKYRAEAIDKLSFYGSFCLLVASPEMMREVEAQRAEVAPPPEKENKVIESITDEGDSDPSLSDGAGTIDAILKGD